MSINSELTAKVKSDYRDRFGIELTSVQEGEDRIFQGSLLIATYLPDPSILVSDVVYVDQSGNTRIFDSTQELILFLRDKARYNTFDAFIESKMFHALILTLLILGVFCAGLMGTAFDPRALAILGSVVGLAAGLFFGPSKK